MKSVSVNYKIENKSVELSLEGDTYVGKDEVLVNQDINLIDGLPWSDKGFSLNDFLSNDQNEQFIKGITEKVKGLVVETGGIVDDLFTLERYHLYVDDEIHLKIAYIIKPGFDVKTFPIDFDLVTQRVAEITNKSVTTEANHDALLGYHLRIVRPLKFQDSNPPHRDVWLDRLRNAVNIYVPICGSSIDSCLPLIPGSHLAKESDIERTKDGALLNGTRYTVPCVISFKGEELTLNRINVKNNEIMVFSPYLIHGGGYNFQENTTRISLEVRFWKK
tara:strand:- start:228 stop:1055 length:828 start_codon:yes stop_codon:yes gene_type:complete